MEIERGERAVGGFVHGERRRDVEQHQTLDGIGMIQRHPVRDARAAIVRADEEALEAEVAHHGDLIGGHRAFGIRRVRGVARRFGRGAIAAQVGRDHGEMFAPVAAAQRCQIRWSADGRAAADSGGPAPPFTPKISTSPTATRKGVKSSKAMASLLSFGMSKHCRSAIRSKRGGLPHAGVEPEHSFQLFNDDRSRASRAARL